MHDAWAGVREATPDEETVAPARENVGRLGIGEGELVRRI
jgi:hypothetical protein